MVIIRYWYSTGGQRPFSHTRVSSLYGCYACPIVKITISHTHIVFLTQALLASPTPYEARRNKATQTASRRHPLVRASVIQEFHVWGKTWPAAPLPWLPDPLPRSAMPWVHTTGRLFTSDATHSIEIPFRPEMEGYRMAQGVLIAFPLSTTTCLSYGSWI